VKKPTTPIQRTNKAKAEKAKKTLDRAHKNAAEKAAKRQAGVSYRPDGLRTGSKEALMLDMVLKPAGATEAAICKKLGWKKCRVTLGRVCDKVSATLTSEGTGAERVFKATMPPKPAASAQEQPQASPPPG